MGTNYYVRPRLSEVEFSDRLGFHLGKMSAGWKFSHHADPSWPREEAHQRWLAMASSGQIRDEYSAPWKLADLLAAIEARQSRLCHCVDNGPEISGRYWGLFRDSQWHDGGYDFTDTEFC